MKKKVFLWCYPVALGELFFCLSLVTKNGEKKKKKSTMHFGIFFESNLLPSLVIPSSAVRFYTFSVAPVSYFQQQLATTPSQIQINNTVSLFLKIDVLI